MASTPAGPRQAVPRRRPAQRRPRRFRGDCAQSLLEACSRATVPIHLVRDGDIRRLGAIALQAMRVDDAFKRAQAAR